MCIVHRQNTHTVFNFHSVILQQCQLFIAQFKDICHAQLTSSQSREMPKNILKGTEATEPSESLAYF